MTSPAFSLPTTPGSIIAFDTWEDMAQTTRFRMVLTLVPGQWNHATQSFESAEWMDTGLQEAGWWNIIANGTNREVLYEAPVAEERTLINHDAPDLQPGSIVLALDYDNFDYGDEEEMDDAELEYHTLCLVPGYLSDAGELADCLWMNAAGKTMRHGGVENNAVKTLVHHRP